MCNLQTFQAAQKLNTIGSFGLIKGKTQDKLTDPLHLLPHTAEEAGQAPDPTRTGTSGVENPNPSLAIPTQQPVSAAKANVVTPSRINATSLRI